MIGLPHYLAVGAVLFALGLVGFMSRRNLIVMFLSAEMMLRHMGWVEAADLVIASMEKSILSKNVTYDFARLLDGATQVSCSGFGQVMIDQM